MLGTLLVGVLAGCSASSSAPLDHEGRTWTTEAIPATTGSPIARALPRIGYHGGPFLSNPRLVTITFPGDDPDLVSRLETFGAMITHSGWWHAVVDAYCVPQGACIGEGQRAQSTRLPERLPAQVNASDIAGILANRAGELGPIDDNTLLLAYLPPPVTLVDERGGAYCLGGERAVHSAFAMDHRRIPYAIVPRCAGEAQTTATASHEILEATTNPDPTRPGFALTPAGADFAFSTAGVEPADPCGLITVDHHHATEHGFTVQPAWSNRSAALGHHPCVPTPDQRPYLALIPDQPTIRLPDIGATTTITLRAAADRPTPPWQITATELTGTQDAHHYLDLTLDHTSVAPGGLVTLTVTVRDLHPDRRTTIGLLSTLNGQTDLWPLAVIQR